MSKCLDMNFEALEYKVGAFRGVHSSTSLGEVD